MELPRVEPIRGRGTGANPANRFEKLSYEPEEFLPSEERPSPTTQFLLDSSRSIIAVNDSPDIGFDAGINPYRGCEHGCIYCYARPFHEYLGFSPGLDFETRILVKKDAPQLLRKELSSPRWQPKMLALSGVTDPYQPIERQYRLTRACLEVLVEFRNPVGIVTKNRLILRDLDLLKQLAQVQAVGVFIGWTTQDPDLARRMEPRTTQPPGRLETIRALKEAGIPVGVLLAPMIPGLTDHEMPQLLAAAREAGAEFAGYVPLRLPHGVKDLFETWLEQHYPQKKDKVLGRIRDLRGGKLNQSAFGERMRGQGIWSEMLQQLFEKTCKKLGLNARRPTFSTADFRRPQDTPTSLFDLA